MILANLFWTQQLFLSHLFEFSTFREVEEDGVGNPEILVPLMETADNLPGTFQVGL